MAEHAFFHDGQRTWLPFISCHILCPFWQPERIANPVNSSIPQWIYLLDVLDDHLRKYKKNEHGHHCFNRLCISSAPFVVKRSHLEWYSNLAVTYSFSVAVSLYIARAIFLLSFIGWFLSWISYAFSRNISWPTVDFHWFYFIFPHQKTLRNILRKKPRIKRESFLQASNHYRYFFHINNCSLGLQKHPYIRTTCVTYNPRLGKYDRWWINPKNVAARR